MNNTGGLNKMFICPISNLSKDGKIISRDKLINIPLLYVLITIDTNGISRLEGNKEEPLHHEYDQKSGSDFSDFNHVELKFSRKLRLPPTILPD